MTRVLTIIALSAVLHAAPTPQTQKASIEGVVLRTETDEPLPGTHVTLIRNSEGASAGTSIHPTAMTDDLGHFVLDNLDPGTYRLELASNGFVKQEYGQKVFPGQGTGLSLAAGTLVNNIVIHLSPAGNLGGRIRNAQGNPAVDAPVQLYRYAYRADGSKGLQYIGGTKADDRGIYRFYWLTPDTYYIYAGGPTIGPGASEGIFVVRNSADNKMVETYRPLFYPGAADFRDATPVRVLSGNDLNGIDLTLSPRQSVAIHGHVIDSGTGTFPAAAVVTVQAPALDGKANTYSARSYYNTTNGAFDIPDLSPGSYMIRVSVPRTPVVPPSVGSVTVTVGNTDLTGILVQTVSPLSISGHAIFDNSANTAATIELRPVAGVMDRIFGTASRDGKLKIDNVPAGDYWLVCISPAYFIQNATYGAEDVLNHPIHFTGGDTSTLEIAFSSKPAEIRGFAHDNQDKPSSGSVAVLVPSRMRERADLYRTAMTDQNGAFTIAGVPAGDYTIFVWEAIEQYAWFDPGLLSRHEGPLGKGKPVHLSESSHETVDLQVIAAGEQQ